MSSETERSGNNLGLNESEPSLPPTADLKTTWAALHPLAIGAASAVLAAVVVGAIAWGWSTSVEVRTSIDRLDSLQQLVYRSAEVQAELPVTLEQITGSLRSLADADAGQVERFNAKVDDLIRADESQRATFSAFVSATEISTREQSRILDGALRGLDQASELTAKNADAINRLEASTIQTNQQLGRLIDALNERLIEP